MWRRSVEASLTVGLSLALTALVMAVIFPIHPNGRRPAGPSQVGVVHAVSVELVGGSTVGTVSPAACPWLTAHAAATRCPWVRSHARDESLSCPYLRGLYGSRSCPRNPAPDDGSVQPSDQQPLIRGLLLASSSHTASTPEMES